MRKATPYGYESVLRQRTSVCQQRKLHLAKRLSQSEEIESRIAELGNRIDDHRRRAGESLKAGRLDVHLLKAAEQQMGRLRAEQRALRDQRQRGLAAISAARAKLLEAERDLKSLQKLCERQQLQQSKQQARHEANRCDEIGQYTAQRRSAA